MKQLCSDWADLDQTLYLSLFRKYVAKTRFSLKSDKNNGHFIHEDVSTFMTISRWILLRIRNVSKKFRENQNTHFMFNNFPAPCPTTENRAICEIISKNVLEPEGPQMAIWRRVACWISKATRERPCIHTYIHALTCTKARARTQICNTYCRYTATVVSRTPLSVTLYVHCLSLNVKPGGTWSTC